MSNLRLLFYLIYCSRVFAIARVIVALSKKMVICKKQTPNFIAFERLDLKHSELDTQLNKQSLIAIYFQLNFYSKYIFTLMLILVCATMNGQEDGGGKLRVNRKNPFVKTRIGISPVLGFYFSNQHHTTGAHQKMSFCISIKEEIRLTKQNRDFLLIGAEYMFHGVGFKSYYFYPDSMQLYTPDRERFTYNLTIHEIDFPIQIKHAFQKETNTIFSSYIFGGYCYRWLVASQLKVSENGNEIVTKAETLTFKSPAFTPANSSFLNIGFGVQKNTLSKHKAIFAELQFKYALSPMQFFESFAPSSMYINGHFIYITVGFKI